MIDVQAVDPVSYALAHNEISVVGSITLASDETVRAASVWSHSQRAAVEPPASWRRISTLAVDGDPNGPLRLDPAQMSQVEEQRAGWIMSRFVGGVLPEQLRQPVKVFAATNGCDLGAGQHRAVRRFALTILRSGRRGGGSAMLQARTASGSLEGYESGEERVDDIVHAIFEASAAHGVRYAEPPVSWTDAGQKVRNPGEVLDGHIGSCLDTTLTLAAALEQAGLRPLIFLTQQHSFLGYWRVEASLGMIVDTEPDRVINLVDLGAIGVGNDHDHPWPGRSRLAAALQRRDSSTGNETSDPVVAVIDVYEARGSGSPTPAVVREPTRRSPSSSTPRLTGATEVVRPNRLPPPGSQQTVPLCHRAFGGGRTRC